MQSVYSPRRKRVTIGLGVGMFVMTALSGLTASAINPQDKMKMPGVPGVGTTAPDFSLKTLDGKMVTLSAVTKKNAVALVVLRGYPGYQCPICTAQVGELIANRDRFSAANAQVLLVYPGPSEELQKRAGEFVSGKDLPANFRLLIDPDYAFVNRYCLRWDAPQETAYPSTFVINKKRKIIFTKVSKSHGGRAKAEEIISALPK